MPKHAGASIAGKNKEKCARYRNRDRRTENKLKRILQSNGRTAHDYYAKAVRLGGRLDVMPRTRGKIPLWQRIANSCQQQGGTQ